MQDLSNKCRCKQETSPADDCTHYIWFGWLLWFTLKEKKIQYCVTCHPCPILFNVSVCAKWDMQNAVMSHFFFEGLVKIEF